MIENYSAADVVDVLNLIEDGFLFERFGQEFLAARMGYSFLSSGGIKDRGIDGLEYVSELEDSPKRIYQISIDKKPEIKIKNTIDKLTNNGITIDRLTYLTNISIKNKDEIIDQYLDQKKITLRIFDAQWIADNSNNSEATKFVIKSFIKDHLRKFQKPGEGLIVSDFVEDPKLYVFLMHQVGRSNEVEKLNDKLIDTLIIYSLRDTDPKESKFKSIVEIVDSVKFLLKFEVEKLNSKVTKRLRSLIRKNGRRVNHHTDIDKYCLPFETRQEIVISNARDKSLYDYFHNEAIAVIKKNLRSESVSISNVASILDSILEKIYYKQGMEFSDFLLKSGSNGKFEGNLNEIAEEVIDGSSIISKNKFKVKDALIKSIRDLIYHGSSKAKEYLVSLSKTYQMLFLLKCDPKIVDFFQSMAGNLNIFVCTSILVPAFSELFLEPQNQRYWSLLKSAKVKGVKLVVNDTIISELDFHIRRSKHIFDEEYKDNIDFYTENAPELVSQILIRSYIYAFKEKKVHHYDQFIENFITINGRNTRQELIDFLYTEFGISYVTNESLGIDVEKDDLDSLTEALTKFKKSEVKARTDANLILSVYAIRKKNGEETSSLDGYKTWWLSSDTMTHRVVSSLFKDKYPVSCYMRPDFLYNYISFTPNKEQISDVYRSTFPNMLGVQISNHLPKEISSSIRKIIKEHSGKLNGRVQAQIRGLVDDLKSDQTIDYKNRLTTYFESKE